MLDYVWTRGCGLLAGATADDRLQDTIGAVA
jgi:hypothetical protein